MRCSLLIVGPLAVTALRVPAPRMSVTAEAAAKAAWLAKLDAPMGAVAPTTAPPAAGSVVPTDARAVAAQRAVAYEERVLGYHSGAPTAYEYGAEHPSTNWAYGPGHASSPMAAAPKPSAPSSNAPDAMKLAQQRAAAYEDRVLGYHSGAPTAYEYGAEHPSTNWAYGPGHGAPAAAPQPAARAAPSTTASEAMKVAQLKAAAYEDRVLGHHSGAPTYAEFGTEHPSTNWAY